MKKSALNPGEWLTVVRGKSTGPDFINSNTTRCSSRWTLSFSEVLLEMGVTVEKVKCAPPMALYPLQGNVVVLVYVRGSSLRRSANCLPEYCVCTADRP